ncbi:ret finger protein-like 4B [Dasypus novemcinctus]|uniref:ret finger protein-like 4B n=1 Tax=Dasypus novemcinctus TaxID=9361 RepID=UPI000328DEAC|nr:ret finger protein-like 4B [Dasypus novemcinctus]
MLERQESTLTCPLCRGVNEKPPKEERQIHVLMLLIKQHGPLLEQSLHLSDASLRSQEYKILDAATANSFLDLSDDLRTIQCGKICYNPLEGPERFTHMACVLGSSCFLFGYHYWEVEVGEGKGWALGVCKDSVNRREKNILSSVLGFWVISMKGKAIYPSSFPQTRIPTSPDLHCVGIFLDVDLEEIKFFDVRFDALIYTQTDLSSLEPLRPFFCHEQTREDDSSDPFSLCL